MRTINSLLEDLANQSDGRFLTSGELQPVQRYLKSCSTRLQTYNLLRDRSEKMVLLALKKFLAHNPELMQKHGKRCQYDMSEAVRYIALAVLKDDERFFKETLLFWQVNILASYRQNTSCLVAYRCLQDIMNEHLPAAAQQLAEPYIEMLLQTLDLPPKLMANVQRASAN